MTVTPINAQTQAITPIINSDGVSKSNPATPIIKELPDEFVSELKSAKTTANIATVAGLSGLAVSGFLLFKAHKMSKIAEPLMNDVKSVQKLCSDVGIDSVSALVEDVIRPSIKKGKEFIIEVFPILEKIQKETNPEQLEAHLAELHNRFMMGIAKAAGGSGK